MRESVKTHVILAPSAGGRGSEEHFRTPFHGDHDDHDDQDDQGDQDDQDYQENRAVNSRSLDFVHRHCVSAT